MSLAEFGNIILRNEPEIVEKTPELLAKFNAIADEIFNCPKRNPEGPRHRTREVIFACVEKMALEHALAQRCGFDLPDWKDWNPWNDHYDVIDPKTGKRFECKSWSTGWYSYFEEDVRTMKNQLAKSRLDYIVAGKVKKTPNAYEVTFRLVADAPSFFNFDNPPNYEKGYQKRWYNHRKAAGLGKAMFLG